MSTVLKAIEEIGDSVSAFRESAEKSQTELRERVEMLEALNDRCGPLSAGRKELKALEDYARQGTGFQTKGMSIVGGASVGQALVPEDIASQILEMALGQSQIAKHVRRTRVSTSDYVRLLNTRGQAASWTSETGTRSETDNFTLREVRPTHGEIFSVVAVTNWLLEDSKFNVAQMILENASAQFAKALDAAIYNGDGSSKPTGIFNTAPVSTADFASPMRAAGAIQYVPTTGDLANDVYDLYFSLKSEYRQNARFACSSGALAGLRKLRDEDGGGFLWQSNLSQAVDAPNGLLAGKPVLTWEDMSASISSSPQAADKLLVGDFQQGYELIEIGGMSVLRDPYTSRGKTLFYIYQRFGGAVVDNNSLKVLRA
jgi:HK97 family phage major capsid protein